MNKAEGHPCSADLKLALDADSVGDWKTAAAAFDRVFDRLIELKPPGWRDAYLALAASAPYFPGFTGKSKTAALSGALDIPPDIIETAEKLHRFFADRGIGDWKLGNVQARRGAGT